LGRDWHVCRLRGRGAPAVTTLYASYGFAAIALATTLIPLSTLLLAAPLHPVAPLPHAGPDFTRVVGAVWMPGLGLALSSVGFGAITTFIVLLFAQHGWGQAWLAFTVLSIAFMAGRLIFGTCRIRSAAPGLPWSAC
jgi:hypothetical protein